MVVSLFYTCKVDCPFNFFGKKKFFIAELFFPCTFYGIKFIQDNRNKRKVSWSYIYLPPFFFILPVVLFNMPGIAVSNEDFMYFLPQKFFKFHFQSVR